MRFIKIIFVLSLTLIVFGCSSLKNNELTVVMSLAEEEWKVMRQDIFPLFEERSGVKIKAYQIESGMLAAKLEALAKAGRPEIDVFAQDNMNLASLVSKNLISDLSAEENLIPKEVIPGLIDACKFNGRLLFMPFRPNVQIAYYNKQAFSKYGISPPRTWEELFLTAKLFKEKENAGRFAIKAYGGNPTATQVYEFILQAGGNPYAFNDEGCVEALRFLKRLGPYLSSESLRAKWDTVNDILARKQAYLAMNWPFGISILIKDYKLDFIATYSGWSGPSGEVHVIGGDVLGIPRNCRNKKVAMDFISFMHTREVQEILVTKLSWPSVRDDAYARAQEFQRPHFESVKEALKNGVFRLNVTWWPAYVKYINLAFRDVVYNGLDVRKTLDKYKAQLEKEKKLHQ